MARQRAPGPPAPPPAAQAGPAPAQPTQPVRVAPGQPYGERQALEGAQQAVPLPAAQPGGAPSPGQGAAPPGGMPSTEGLFAPSAIPGPGGPLPPDAGNKFVANDPDMLLRAIYQAYPHPEIARLMRALR